MRLSFPALFVTGMLLAAVPCVAGARPHHASSSAHTGTRHTGGKSHKSGKTAYAVAHHEAPAAMDTTRATEIQTALIRQGYMTGEPTGHWDTDSVAAMQKLQGDHGWQTKITPDSRALITLGLGPQQQAAIESTK